MRRFWSTRTAFLIPQCVLLGLIVLVAADQLQIVQFNYPRFVDNDPLLSPNTVRSISGTKLLLGDGRTLRMDGYDGNLDQPIQDSDFRVDMEPGFYFDDRLDRDSPRVLILVKHRRRYCGRPFMGLIQMPLLPVDVPKYSREPIGFATVVHDPADDDT